MRSCGLTALTGFRSTRMNILLFDWRTSKSTHWLIHLVEGISANSPVPVIQTLLSRNVLMQVLFPAVSIVHRKQ